MIHRQEMQKLAVFSLARKLSEPETNRQQRFARRVSRQGAQCTRRLQRTFIEQARTTAFLDPGSDHLAIMVEHNQYQNVSFNPLGNGFGRVENPLPLLLEELPLNFLRPRFYNFCCIFGDLLWRSRCRPGRGGTRFRQVQRNLLRHRLWSAQTGLQGGRLGCCRRWGEQGLDKRQQMQQQGDCQSQQ